MKIPAQLPWHLSSWGWVSPGIRVSRITVALSLPCCGAVYIHGLRILPVLPATLGIWYNCLTYLKWRMTSCLLTVKLLHFQVLVRVPLWTLGRCFEPGGNNRFFSSKFFFFNTEWEENIEVSNTQKSNILLCLQGSLQSCQRGSGFASQLEYCLGSGVFPSPKFFVGQASEQSAMRVTPVTFMLTVSHVNSYPCPSSLNGSHEVSWHSG